MLITCLSISCLVLHVWVSHVSLECALWHVWPLSLYVMITSLAFLCFCIFAYALYVLVASLASCHHVWSLYVDCTLACLFVCLLAYLVYVTKPCFKIWIHVGSHLSIYTKSRDPLLGALLIDKCVVLNSIQWIYRHRPNLHLWRLSIYASLFVCLIACFLLFVCLLACFHLFFCLLTCVSISLFFCLVFLFVCLHVVDGACTLLPKGKQNGIDQ